MDHTSHIRSILNIFEDNSKDYSTSLFTYDKEQRVLIGNCSDLKLKGFPKTLTLKSDQTGRIVMFIKDEQSAIDNEFWDGEMYEYIPSDSGKVNVKKLIIISQ